MSRKLSRRRDPFGLELNRNHAVTPVIDQPRASLNRTLAALTVPPGVIPRVEEAWISTFQREFNMNNIIARCKCTRINTMQMITSM
jgi:hypothetical protein